MTDQLFRWVKATDALPPAGSEVKMKWDDGDKEWHGDPIDELRDIRKQYYHKLLWQQPTPFPVSGSLQQRLTEIRNQLYEEMPSGEIKDSWGFIQAIKKHFERLDEFIDKELAGASRQFIGSSKLVEALEDFLSAVPPQTDDADWWPDNLCKAVECAKKFLVQYNAVEPEKQRDEFFNEAAELVVLNDAGSTSLLQRKLKLTYSRACKIMQELAEAGIVGEYDAARPRKVLIKTKDELLKLLNPQPSSQSSEHKSDREPEETEIEKLKDSLGAAKMALEAIMKGEAIFPRTLAQQTLIIINGE